MHRILSPVNLIVTVIWSFRSTLEIVDTGQIVLVERLEPKLRLQTLNNKILLIMCFSQSFQHCAIIKKLPHGIIYVHIRIRKSMQQKRRIDPHLIRPEFEADMRLGSHPFFKWRGWGYQVQDKEINALLFSTSFSMDVREEFLKRYSGQREVVLHKSIQIKCEAHL